MRHVTPILVTILVLFGALGVIGFGVYRHYDQGLPNFDALADYQPSTVTRVHAGDGRLLAEFATQKRVFVPIAAIPPRIIQAVLAAEDRDFYSHGGIDPPAIIRAALTDLLRAGSGRRQIGASTITQQVAKKFVTGDEYSYSRKIREMIVAIRMEDALSKNRILELYLNQVYFGRGAYGIAAAALTYFNKSLDELTTSEAAFLAALLKGPVNYDPARHYQAAFDRRNYVIDGMAETGAITPAEAAAAKQEPIVLRRRDDTVEFSAPFFTEEVRRELIGRYGEKAVYENGLSVRTSLNPALQSAADRALRDGLIAYDRKHGYRGPVGHIAAEDWQKTLAAMPLPAGATPWVLALVRAVDHAGAELGLADGSTGWLPMKELAWARPELPNQRMGEFPKTPEKIVKPGDVVLVERLSEPTEQAKPAAPRRHLAAVSEHEGMAVYGLRQIPEVSGAIVVLDPHTGRVLALSGGYSYDMSQFDRATQAYRQIGSAIKPFAYLAALDNGFTPSTLILDAPVAIEQGPGLPLWRPANFETNEYRGPTPLRVGIEKSINTMTVRMASIIGIDKIAPYIERLGIMDKVPREYSMVLGAGETTALRLTTAYAMLDNGGKKIVPSLIDRVQDRDGKTIFRHDTRDCPRCGDYDWAPQGEPPPLEDDREQLINPVTAYQMVNILRGVVERGTAAGSVGRLPWPLAGKTGTTNEAKDTWFVGFSPDLVAGVYVGFDQPRTLGFKEQGATVAAPIFAEFMAQALKDTPPVDFRIPPGVRLVRVNPATGKLADPDEVNAIWEAFKPDTEPTPEDQVVQGGAGIETLTSDDAAPGSVAGDIEPGDSGTPETAAGAGEELVPAVSSRPQVSEPEPVKPSSATGGLY